VTKCVDLGQDIPLHLKKEFLTELEFTAALGNGLLLQQPLTECLSDDGLRILSVWAGAAPKDLILRMQDELRILAENSNDEGDGGSVCHNSTKVKRIPGG
jgi:hypothetical protein